jgi:hypothetical protein
LHFAPSRATLSESIGGIVRVNDILGQLVALFDPNPTSISVVMAPDASRACAATRLKLRLKQCLERPWISLVPYCMARRMD